MNRLVIIGNGFDLAHGLPTSYRHFIDNYWKSVTSVFNYEKKSSFKDNFIEVNYEFMSSSLNIAIVEHKNINSYAEFNSFVKRYESGYNSYQYTDKNDCSLTFTNKFFEVICEKSIENWVDIENVYYEILKGRVKGNYLSNNYPWDITQLNKEFEEIKDLLHEYLVAKVENSYDFDINNVLEYSNLIVELEELKGENLERFFKEIPFDDMVEIDNEISEFYIKQKYEKNLDIQHFYVNFNYTGTLLKYFEKLEINKNKLIQIHGELNSEENSINFGFGDEMDEDYKMIENIDDNEYLNNFKSFQYLNTNNYKSLLDLIDADKFQVYLMGHSCGLSDRTLLNTIFEHSNCRSIKVFYHETKDKEGNVIKDNYTDIIQNISRHFNKKKMMREKIVNKTLCKPLPQIKLPLK
ncbi:Bacteriophage abortive infection AbiH [Flavobacterium swingsii]|uniref:Bacteriophage abortive infection AbiH n=1 Tax=Flavobacterium swingsii TaxID=498292 RepID=A0A1I0XGL7_9FLAO|nr:AbiH family protein [Flavobacterium swingsii]SFB00175.1 Bacteriophage abortive infection AbiH [Flavobacterium swingsii]